MNELLPLLGLSVTVGLTLTQPRLGRVLRVDPAIASALGLLFLLAAGATTPSDLLATAAELWRPLVGVTAIIVNAAVARRLGVLDRLASLIEPATRGPVKRAFAVTFVLSALTAALLNNDAAVLVLTPLVVGLTSRLYPLRPYLPPIFAFAVFGAAGIAPLVVSNPMNFVVATQMGIDFNAYALRMLPIALVCWLVSYAALRLYFHPQLDDPIPARGPERAAVRLGRAGWFASAIFALTLLSYPLVSVVKVEAWMIAAVGALLLVALCWGAGVASPRQVAREVPWEILAFLFAVFVMVNAMARAGLTAHLTQLYGLVEPGAFRLVWIGGIAALGSMLMNNHPMALVSCAALRHLPGLREEDVLAALLGGDLGPRLLPIGSLAGLLWLSALRKEGFRISLRQFVAVGAATGLPALAATLASLALLAR